MTKKSKARDAMLADVLAEVRELRALLLTAIVRLDRMEEPLFFDPVTGALSEDPVDVVPPTLDADLLTVAEAATMLSVSAFTVREMCKDGRLIATKESNAAGWRIDKFSVLDEWNRRWG